MADLANEFIKMKGLEEEYKAFVKQREDNANGIEIKFDIMLGDADGNHKETICFTNDIIEEFRKYFEASEWNKAAIKMKEVELLEVSHEWMPGGTLYADQLQMLFKQLHLGETSASIRTDNEHSLARFSYDTKKADVDAWFKDEYYEETENLDPETSACDLAETLEDFFHDIYFRYVKPYVESGKFEYADKLGHYGIYG